MIARRFVIAGALAAMVGWITAASGNESIAAIRTTSQARQRYLARAIIWRSPPDLTPTDLLQGPRDVFPYTAEEASEGIPCTFAPADGKLGGASPKFLCQTADGPRLRVKYWDPQSGSGNREVFATVAASRLLWALGFNAVPALSIDVRCEDCPENPAKGSGRRRPRRYVAALQAFWPTPSILSGDDVDQGWSWRELDAAIRSLPSGAGRTRQRTHFDALTLLGVFIQHGDRKPRQQRLYCAAPIDTTVPEGRALDNRAPVLFEPPGTVACPSPAVTILDAGLTFGGAGRTSNDRTATMNLAEWRNKPVFRTNESGQCRGQLIVSFKAGGDGEPNPVISEEGRLFLLGQFHRLTLAHVRAIFAAARVDQLDAWVGAFTDRVRQIEAQRCRPLERAEAPFPSPDPQ
ncbi:MAG TPA: hypothetical protein VKC35_19880 [Vicinamibacterales bacterium]|nr:hypothetical protein [Vicinamibacterales bacterium]